MDYCNISPDDESSFNVVLHNLVLKIVEVSRIITVLIVIVGSLSVYCLRRFECVRRFRDAMCGYRRREPQDNKNESEVITESEVVTERRGSWLQQRSVPFKKSRKQSPTYVKALFNDESSGDDDCAN